MSEVDFGNPDAAKIWFAAQDAPTKCTVASRSAIRVLPNIIVGSEGRFNTIALAAFRALLTSASFGSMLVGIAAALSSSSLSARLASNETAPGGFAFGSDVDTIFAVRDAVRAAAYSAKSNFDDFAYEAVISSANSAQHANNSKQGAASFEGAVFASIFGAATVDAKKLRQRVVFGPLWDGLDIPLGLLQNHTVLVERLAGDPDWTFWRRWYLSMWDGTWTDWNLAHEVAKIENDVWEGEDALTKVAARIEQIKEKLGRELPRPDSVPELERSQLTEHVKKLLTSPEMTAIAADGAAETLRRAITEYLKLADKNCLPDELAHLQDLPALFESISSIVQSSDGAEAKERQLEKQIAALNEKVAKLEAALKEARSKTVNGIFTQNALAAAGKAFGTGVIGTLGLATVHFFGQWPDDLTFENLRGWLDSLGSATPISDGNHSLPPATDI